MSNKLINRLDQLDSLISKKSTGTPKQLSLRLHVCERQAREYINILKDFGGPIKYSRKRNTYFYQYSGEFSFRFQKIKTPHEIL